MCKKRVMKNLFLMILMGVMFVFGVETVDAATCEYLFDASNIRSAPTAKEVHLSMTIASDSTLVFSSATLMNTDGTSEKITISTPFPQDLVVESSSCPVLYLYKGEWNGKWKVFSKQERCDEDRAGNCPRDCFSSATYGEVKKSYEGELLPAEICSDTEIQEFDSKTSGMLDEVETLYNQYEDKVEQISLSRLTSNQGDILNQDYIVVQGEFTALTEAFGDEIEALVEEVNGYILQYNCVAVSEKSLKLIEDINNEGDKYLEQLEGVWVSRLDAFKTSLGDAADSEVVANIEQLQESAGATTEKVQNDLEECVKKYVEPLEAQLGAVVDSNCEEILGDILDLIQKAFDIIKIAAPILLIFFGSLDFAKAVIAGDDKATKKATSDFMKRTAAAVLIFFIPFFIELLFNLPGVELGIKDILCGISKVVVK